MPRVTHVKAARKDNPVCKKGESYDWWSTRSTIGKRYVSHKHYSLTRPKRSQLTQSDFLSQMYDIEDEVIAGFDNAGDSLEELRSMVEDAVEQIRGLGDECCEKLDNMPEGLQDGPTGELLQSRSDECESMADELEQIDLDDYDGPEWGPDKPGKNDPPDEFVTWLENTIEELQAIEYTGE